METTPLYQDIVSDQEVLLETRWELQGLCLGVFDPPPWLTRQEAIDEAVSRMAVAVLAVQGAI